MPLDTVHRLDDGATRDHRANPQRLRHAKRPSTYEGLRKLQGEERPFVLTRAAIPARSVIAATLDRRPTAPPGITLR